MRVLITGAAGRMGAHLTRLLAGEGHQVRAFVLPGDPNNQQIDGPNVEIVPGRLEDPESVGRAVDGVDAIVALAGALTSRLASDQQFFDANLGGTFNLLMAARTRAPNLTRFIYASSDAVYWSGAVRPAAFLPVDESHPRQPGSIYGATKLGAEELCLTFMRAYGIPATIIRPTATADAWELIEPDSVFGRRLFVGGAIRFIEAAANPSADELELLAALRVHDTGRDRLFVLADLDGRVATTILSDARDTAAGLRLMLTAPGSGRGGVQHRPGGATFRGGARGAPRVAAGTRLRCDPAAGDPRELVRLECQGARRSRLRARSLGLRDGRRGGGRATGARRCRIVTKEAFRGG